MQITSTPIVKASAQNSTDTSSGSTATGATQSLSQSDFLKLLVAQMTSQDPINPTSSQDLLTQTVQLSTLQSNTSLQSTLTQLKGSESLSQAGSLLGRQVSVQVDSNTVKTGLVSGVNVSSGTPQIIVDSTAYDLSQVLSISAAPANP